MKKILAWLTNRKKPKKEPAGWENRSQENAGLKPLPVYEGLGIARINDPYPTPESWINDEFKNDTGSKRVLYDAGIALSKYRELLNRRLLHRRYSIEYKSISEEIKETEKLIKRLADRHLAQLDIEDEIIDQQINNALKDGA